MTGMSRRKVIALILATLLPVASIALMLWSYHDRADAATNVKAAVVNLDEMATIGKARTLNHSPVVVSSPQDSPPTKTFSRGILFPSPQRATG